MLEQSGSRNPRYALWFSFVVVGSLLHNTVRAQDRQSPSPLDTAITAAADAQDPPAKPETSPWVLAPLVSSSPKLGTSFGALTAYATKFDPGSRLSLIGLMAQYTSTDSIIAALFSRLSFGADHHRIIAVAAFGNIKNDYDDYLGTGQPLRTNDDLKSVATRYSFRVTGNWLIGAQFNAANYQVLGATPEDDFILETLGVRGFKSVALGAVVMHDSRDNEDMPTRGLFVNVNNLAYREGLGGADSYDAYRADIKGFVAHGAGHVLAFRQYNWLTNEAPAAGQGSVILRGYKFGEYLAPYMSSLEAEERLSFGRRVGATLFGGFAALYGNSPTPLDRQVYPMFGAGLQFILKPDKRLLVNLEYAQGVQNNRGVYLKFGYGW